MSLDLREIEPGPQAYFEEIFSHLPEGAESKLRMLRCRAGTEVIRSVNRVGEVYFLLSGIAYARNELLNGDVYRYARFEAPYIFGEYEAYAMSEWYRGTIICETDCLYACMSMRDYLDWVRGDPELLFMRTCAITRDLLRQVRSERSRLFRRGMDRICALLVTLAVQNRGAGGTVRLRCTRQRIAELVGCSVKTVQRSLKRLCEADCLSLRGQELVLTPEQLERLKQYSEKIAAGAAEEEYL